MFVYYCSKEFILIVPLKLSSLSVNNKDILNCFQGSCETSNLR